MSNDNVLDFPGMTSADLDPTAVLEAIAETHGEGLERVCVVGIGLDGSLRLFNSCNDDDKTISDLSRALHGFVAETFED